MLIPTITYHFINRSAKRLLAACLPYRCFLCGTLSDTNLALCHACQMELPRLQHACRQCAKPLPPPLPASGLCGECLRAPPAFDRVIAPFRYQFPINKLLLGLKFSHQRGHGQLLGHLLAIYLDHYYACQPKPDLMIPIPLHPERLHQRGYNQATVIAQPAARQLELPLLTNGLIRPKATLAQAQLPGSKRSANVAGAFAIGHLPAVRHVALIDDIITTGATITEASRLLRRQGVQEITVICCARAVLDGKQR